jgi:ribosomal protein L11 methyltransferase
MMNSYYTKLVVECDQDFCEILMAELAELGFDTFLENEKGFEAYVEDERYDKQGLQEVRTKYEEYTRLHFAFEKVEKKNWNEEWEKNYEPIIVDNRCLIRASFHQIEKQYPYEIIITPKMSFGTGHHQTTYLMIKNQMDFDHKGKRVMDAGCGTAILSIMASKLGATAVEAFDIDEWSVTNGSENIDVNNCNNVHLQLGKITEVKLNGKFDIVLANINKNVLLSEISLYVDYLNPGGNLLLSGFYTHDIPDLLEEANKLGMKEVKRDERETWACLLLSK